jgi:IS5 family transposase
MIVGVMTTCIEPKQPGLFDAQDRLEELHEMGDPLQRLDRVIDWDVFRPVLAAIPKDDPKGPGGRPAFDPLLMLKVMVIGHLYNLSDAQLEFQITDRHSFKRFLGITDADKAPDEKTIWAFRDVLVKNDLMKKAFVAFHGVLEQEGLFARKGQMVDASFVEVPRQRNSREDNAAIKQGEMPEGWEDQPEMLRQKDRDARWTKNNLTSRQRRSNRAKSRIRVRVEHVFGIMHMCMRAAWNRCIGITRNRAAIAMTNLVYNMIRFEQIDRLALKTW